MPDSAPARSFPDEAIDTSTSSAPRRRMPSRGRLFAIFGVVLAVIALIVVGYWLIIGQFHVSTDNAYVDAQPSEVTPQGAGQIVGDDAYDTEPVKAGQVLIKIDDTDAKIALASAQAALGQAERKVRGYFAQAEAL